MEKTRKLNNLVRVAKYGANFIPTKRAVDLPIGKFYQIIEATKRATKWGDRVALKILDNNDEYLVYLGEFESNKDRMESIRQLLVDEDKDVYVAVESVEERTAPAQPIAHYDFRIKDKNSVEAWAE